MVRHVIIWTLKKEYSVEKAQKIKADIKEGLENLKGKIPGLVEITVYTNALSTSNTDLMLDSVFENEDALHGYAVHPEHVAVATTKVRPFIEVRSCMDFEI